MTINANFDLLPAAVLTVCADSKQEILQVLAHCFADTYGVDALETLESLEERERLGSTGFGRGLAIPHARIDGLMRPVAALFRLESPVDFAAADGMPVDLVVGLLSPRNAGVLHLHALAAISRMVRDDAAYEALTSAETAEALFATLTNIISSAPKGGLDRDAA